MRKIAELFDVARELQKQENLKFSLTEWLIFMYLTGSVSTKEAKLVEHYFNRKNITADTLQTYAAIVETNNIKGVYYE